MKTQTLLVASADKGPFMSRFTCDCQPFGYYRNVYIFNKQSLRADVALLANKTGNSKNTTIKKAQQKLHQRNLQ